MKFMFILLVIVLNGCAVFRSAAVRSQEKLAESAVKVFLSERDYILAEESVASSLKTLESLADATPESKLILTLTSRAFFMYSFAFVEDKSFDRASSLYLRGLRWGAKAFSTDDIFFNYDTGEFERLFRSLEGEQVDCALWSLVNFSCWLNINRSSIKAVANRYKVKLAADILLDKIPDKYYGLLYALKGLDESSVPAALGGDLDAAESYFRRSITISKGAYLPIRYLFAKYYAVAVQDAELFNEQISLIDEFNIDLLPSERLTNILIKKRAENLSARQEDLFF